MCGPVPSRGNSKYTVQSLCVVVLLRECEQNTSEQEGREQDSQRDTHEGQGGWVVTRVKGEPTMQKQEGSFSKGHFCPESPISSADASQMEGLLILPCSQQVFGLLI